MPSRLIGYSLRVHFPPGIRDDRNSPKPSPQTLLADWSRAAPRAAPPAAAGPTYPLHTQNAPPPPSPQMLVPEYARRASAPSPATLADPADAFPADQRRLQSAPPESLQAHPRRSHPQRSPAPSPPHRPA